MAVKNSLTKQSPAQKKMPLTAYLTNDAVRDQISKVVGGKDGQRFISSIISAVQVNPKLSECTNASILSAALLGESLKLSPSPQLGYFYMVPYQNKNMDLPEAQFQLGYKGYIQLASRTGNYKKLNVLPIKEGELIHYDPLNEEIEVNLIQDEIEREKAPTIGYYAMFSYINGFQKAIYWSKEKMLAHADRYSKAFSLNATGGKYPKVSYADYVAGNYDPKDEWKYSSFWYKDFDAMACKTMLRQLISRWGIMSIELQTAYENDMAVIREDGGKEYVDIVSVEEVPEEPAVAPEPAAEPPHMNPPTDTEPVSENPAMAALFNN